MYEIAQAIGSIATAVGVFVAAWQLNLQEKSKGTDPIERGNLSYS